MSEIQPRIIGTEMEWPMSVRLANNDEFTQLTGTRGIEFRLPDGLLSAGTDKMLSNGARYYHDVGDRLEYATPETTSFDDIVVREFAGEQIVMRGLVEYARDSEKVAAVALSKRVLDSFQTGWGYHVNLAADKTKLDKINDDTAHLLALHLATSVPMLGGGAVYHDADGKLRYSYGQKALSLNVDYSSDTVTGKPLVNSRHENHASGTDIRRVHITSLDPHVSPWATKMTLGTCSLILRAIEQGKGRGVRLSSGLGKKSLSELMRRTATDITMIHTTRMSTGRIIKPLGIQEKLIGIVEQTDHTDEEAIILQEWKAAFATLETDPTQLIGSDAIAKLGLIRAWMQRNKVDDFDHRAIQGIDGMYTRLLFFDKDSETHATKTSTDLYEQSLAYKLRTGKFKSDLPIDRSVTDAVLHPPTTTRAFQRGNAIAEGTVTDAKWEHYSVGSRFVRINDPRIPNKVEAVT